MYENWVYKNSVEGQKQLSVCHAPESISIWYSTHGADIMNTVFNEIKQRIVNDPTCNTQMMKERLENVEESLNSHCSLIQVLFCIAKYCSRDTDCIDEIISL